MFVHWIITLFFSESEIIRRYRRKLLFLIQVRITVLIDPSRERNWRKRLPRRHELYIPQINFPIFLLRIGISSLNIVVDCLQKYFQFASYNIFSTRLIKFPR